MISKKGLKILKKMNEEQLKDYIINKTFGWSYSDIIKVCKKLKKLYGLNTDYCINYCMKCY